jgi:hypothetical protein
LYLHLHPDDHYIFVAAKVRRINSQITESARRRFPISAEQCEEVSVSSPKIEKFTEAFKLEFLECEEHPERWGSYAAMVGDLEQKYGARSICGWLHGPSNVWTAPLDETWEPRVTPDIQDIRDVHEYANQTTKKSRRCFDAVDAWKRWFYPLKHFFYKQFELDDDVVDDDDDDDDDADADAAAVAVGDVDDDGNGNGLHRSHLLCVSSYLEADEIL